MPGSLEAGIACGVRRSSGCAEGRLMEHYMHGCFSGCRLQRSARPNDYSCHPRFSLGGACTTRCFPGHADCTESAFDDAIEARLVGWFCTGGAPRLSLPL